MEKIVMYLKKVIILLCGIVLGYLTSRRTDMSISLECILGDGVYCGSYYDYYGNN